MDSLITYKKPRGRGGEERRPLCDGCLWCLLLGEQNNTICTILNKHNKSYTANGNTILNREYVKTPHCDAWDQKRNRWFCSCVRIQWSSWTLIPDLWKEARWWELAPLYIIHYPGLTLKIALAFSEGRRRTLLSGGSAPRLPGTPAGKRIRQIFSLAKQTTMCTYALKFMYLMGVS